jgi:glycosyltransferase involved in cell wall biosynthesis
MKQRIAVIFEGNISNRLGVFNAVVNRVKHLRSIAPYDIDLFMIQVYDTGLTRLLRRSKPVGYRPLTVEAEGETLSLWWVKRSLCDSLLHRFLGKKPARFLKRLRQLGKGLEGYAIVSAHDRIAGHVARAAHDEHSIPYFITWHGASIYTDPPRDPMLKALTVDLLHDATNNFFVSEGLVKKAELLTTGFPHQVLLNGANSAFHRYDDEKRQALREKYGLGDAPVVAFVGRFEPVKNVTMLPEIFTKIAKKYGGKVKFWTIGNGWQHPTVEKMMQETSLDCKMWGALPPEQMPEMMNCMSVLILPSSLEGLPLVTIEALACGANVAASNVVGTAESIGCENAFDLDDEFIENITDRAVQMLNGEVTQTLPPDVSWSATAIKENNIYLSHLNNK